MPTWQRHNPAGFTLVEVLVAMAIVSIALLAALRVAALGTNQVGELHARLLAGWVATDRLAEHRARTDWLPVGVHSGTQQQGNLAFGWREEVSATPNPAFRRVDVFVYAPADQEHVLAHAAGFVVDLSRSSP